MITIRTRRSAHAIPQVRQELVVGGVVPGIAARTSGVAGRGALLAQVVRLDDVILAVTPVVASWKVLPRIGHQPRAPYR